MKLTGSCLCKSLAWETSAAPSWACYCHCDSCRTQCAAPATAFFGVPTDTLIWSGQRATYQNADVTRSFCATCGTPMAYEADRFPGEIHVYIAHLDQKGAVKPTFHVHHAEAEPYMAIHDALPRYPGSGNDGGATVLDLTNEKTE